MGHNANVKLLRKQVRNVALETLPNVLKDESVKEINKSLNQLIGSKLDVLSDNVTKEVEKIDKQTQTFRGMIFRDASLQISRELANINLTMLAWQKIITEYVGVEDIADFEKKVSEKKLELEKQLEAEAKVKQEAEEAAALEASKNNKKALEDKIAEEKPSVTLE